MLFIDVDACNDVLIFIKFKLVFCKEIQGRHHYIKIKTSIKVETIFFLHAVIIHKDNRLSGTFFNMYILYFFNQVVFLSCINTL